MVKTPFRTYQLSNTSPTLNARFTLKSSKATEKKLLSLFWNYICTIWSYNV